MFTIEHLNPKKYPTTRILESNMLVLYQRVKLVESLWMVYQRRQSMLIVPDEFTCNSGLRSEAHQLSLIKAGRSTATHSQHLYGAACDIKDEDGRIKEFLRIETAVLEEAHLWCEHWTATLSWVHFQIVPPKSGSRWFYP